MPVCLGDDIGVSCVFVGRKVERDDEQTIVYHAEPENQNTSSTSISNIKAIRRKGGDTEALVGEDRRIVSAKIKTKIPWRNGKSIQVFVKEINEKVANIMVHGIVNQSYHITPEHENLVDIKIDSLGMHIKLERKQRRWFFDIVDEGDCSKINKRDLHDMISNKFSEESELLIIDDKGLDLDPEYNKNIPEIIL